jgi:hypothetical protein
MDVTSVGSRLEATRFAMSDVAAVLAARPSMAQMSSKAASEAATNQDQLAESTRAVSAAGTVDMYL